MKGINWQEFTRAYIEQFSLLLPLIFKIIILQWQKLSHTDNLKKILVFFYFLLLTQDLKLLQGVKVKIQGKFGYYQQPAHLGGARSQVASQLHSTHVRVVVYRGRSRILLILLNSRMFLFLSSRKCFGKVPTMH